MKLEEFLYSKKERILKQWFSSIIATYPPDVSSFLKTEHDRFANPVGYTIRAGIETLFDELTGGNNLDNITSALDSIIRIRAVQDFNASEALNFVFLLKHAVRNEIQPNSERSGMDHARQILEELLQFETRLDSLVSLAFDIYTRCRDDIHRIKIAQANPKQSMARHRTRIIRSTEDH